MTGHVPGITLSRRLYESRVGPLVAEHLPGLRHASALLGRGSEVLGFDDEMSTDHDWAARVLLFLTESDEVQVGAQLRDHLGAGLPEVFEGHPVTCEVHTIRDYLRRELALDVDRPLRAADWLTMPEHGLRTIASGAVFHDEVGLERVRARLSYYPRDVWFYLMITAWWRVGPEANLVGRAGDVGDELGSSLIGARLTEDLMRLAFLLERQYAPYAKWFGTAFSRLACAPALTPALDDVLRASSWRQREAALIRGTQVLVEVHNALGLTDPVAGELVAMWDRPFQVAWSEIPDLLHDMIEDPEVVRIAESWPVGPVDRLRELVWAPRHRAAVLRLFDDPPATAGAGEVTA